ncbi:hypothetical protein DFH28DRAFT_881045 [Melampsora americana]|nr:hypothetical protein DFH28DRAFT_881045 [Melampsora americana]
MPGNPYISAKYRRMPSYPTLPHPKARGHVGLACPECPSTNAPSLEYSSADDETKDTINIHCPKQRHYVRTFKLNQLIHEIGCINAGAPYPIEFNPSAYGPPVNIKGLPVPARASPTTTSTRAKPTGPTMDCARPNLGPTAKTHKKAGHRLCAHRFCKSCCLVYGTPGVCLVHRVKEAPPPGPANRSITPPNDIPAAKRPRILPAQYAQSIGRVGRILTEDGQLVLAAARVDRTESVRKAASPSIALGKVVSLHLVTQGGNTPVISHLFDKWPLAALNDCPSLLREAQAAAGQDWHGQLLVWEEHIRKWREIPVNLPHRYTRTSRNLVICVPSQRSTLTSKLQDVLEGLGMGKPCVPQTTTASEPTGPVPTASSSNSFIPRPQQVILELDSSSDSDDRGDIAEPSTATAIEMPPVPSTPDTPSHFDPALFAEDFNVIPEPFVIDSQPPPKEPAKVLQEWPGEDTLASHLLAWYQSAGGVLPRRKARIGLWIERFGGQYVFSAKTVYRYATWIDLVGYDRMQAWVNHWPEVGNPSKHNLTVAHTRRNFQLEFNEACSLGQKAVRDRGLGIGPAHNPIPVRLNGYLQGLFFWCVIGSLRSLCYSLTLLIFIRSIPASPAQCFSVSEDLGWNALPFDKPDDDLNPNTSDHLRLTSNWVFGLAERDGINRRTPEVFKYKWGCNLIDIVVFQNRARFSYDGRYTYSAVWRQGNKHVPLDACALHPNQSNLLDHLRFAQMYAHADCLLQKFKKVLLAKRQFNVEETRVLRALHVVNNLVLFKAKGSKPLIEGHTHWFNLREKVPAAPEYITSDDAFDPEHRAPTLLGRVFECFTHWTYEYHHRQALICGFHGSGSVITDLRIMDNMRGWFLRNPYTGGLQLFARTHKCNHFCRSVGLTPPPPYYPVGLPHVNPAE